MADWTDLPNTGFEPGQPVKGSQGRALKDNPIFIAEWAEGAPRIKTPGIDDRAVTLEKLALNTVGLVPISEAFASNDVGIDFTLPIQTYDHFVVTGTGVIPENNGVDFRMRGRIPGGSFETFNYRRTNFRINSQGPIVNEGDNAASGWFLCREPIGNQSFEGVSFRVEFWPKDRSRHITMAVHVQDTDFQWTEWSGGRSGGGASDALRFYFGSGNIASGTFRLYGVKKR